MESSGQKIALINVSIGDQGYPSPPLGLLSIASYLIDRKIIERKNILVLNSYPRDPMEYLKHFKPDLIGISAMTQNYPDAIKLGEKFKVLFPKAPIVLGGVHISLSPSLLHKLFCLGVIGEGEKTFFELVEIFSKTRIFPEEEIRKVKGIVFRTKRNDLIMTASRPLINPLDEIPPIDWSLSLENNFRPQVAKFNGKWTVLKTAPILTARGCPFHCAFCTRFSLWKGVRYFSVRRVVDEIETLVREYKVKGIIVWDDTFNLSKDRLKQIIELLREKELLGKISFPHIFARTDLIDVEFLELIKNLGDVNLYYGFESASSKILAYLKEGMVTISDNKMAAELTDKFNIGISGGFMLGSPNETKEDMEKTLNFIKWMIRKKNLQKITIRRVTPYPGTKLWDYALEKGIVSKRLYRNLSCKTINPKGKIIPFFTEKIKPEEFNQIWRKANKLKLTVDRKLQKEKGFIPAVDLCRRQIFAMHALSFFETVRSDIKNGRFLIAIKRISEKFLIHLFSFKNLQGDLVKIKILFSNQIQI